jgi:hypothetical protein
MAKKHAATLEFTEKKVGSGCDNKRKDVETVQELLVAAGELNTSGAAGGWGPRSTAALQSFRNKHGTGLQCTPACLEPNDELLLLMAEKAGLVITLSGFPGWNGVKSVHEWLGCNNIKYNEGAQHGRGNRALWGVHDNTTYVVETISGGFTGGKLEMDCTIYVNLMISIYLKGNAHTEIYAADCSRFGGVAETHLARERYGFALVRRESGGKSLNYFSTAEQIAEATKGSPSSLYVLEVGEGSKGTVKHMALLYGSRVYECTINQPNSSCIDRTLEDFVKPKADAGKILYLFGPK